MIEQTKNEALKQFIVANNEALEGIQAEVLIGDLTGHGEEWRGTLHIKEEIDDENEGEHETTEAVFSFFSTNEGAPLTATLELQFSTSEGVIEKWPFSIGKFETARELLDDEDFENACNTYELSESEIEVLGTFIEQCYPVMVQLKNQ